VEADLERLLDPGWPRLTAGLPGRRSRKPHGLDLRRSVGIDQNNLVAVATPVARRRATGATCVANEAT
jgi:hypothetical protein